MNTSTSSARWRGPRPWWVVAIRWIAWNPRQSIIHWVVVFIASVATNFALNGMRGFGQTASVTAGPAEVTSMVTTRPKTQWCEGSVCWRINEGDSAAFQFSSEDNTWNRIDAPMSQLDICTDAPVTERFTNPVGREYEKTRCGWRPKDDGRGAFPLETP